MTEVEGTNRTLKNGGSSAEAAGSRNNRIKTRVMRIAFRADIRILLLCDNKGLFARLRPTRALLSRFAQPAEIISGVNERNMREGLRKVSDETPTSHVIFL